MIPLLGIFTNSLVATRTVCTSKNYSILQPGMLRNSGRFGNLPLINYLLKTTGWQQLARRRVAANDVFTCLSSLTSALNRWQIGTGQCYFLTGNVSVETSICSSWGEVAVAKRHTRIHHTEAQRASSLHIMCSHRPVAVSSYSFSVWGS
jgi:hypothetical protein